MTSATAVATETELRKVVRQARKGSRKEAEEGRPNKRGADRMEPAGEEAQAMSNGLLEPTTKAATGTALPGWVFPAGFGALGLVLVVGLIANSVAGTKDERSKPSSEGISTNLSGAANSSTVTAARTVAPGAPMTSSCPSGMVSLPTGQFKMGSEDWSDAKPVHDVSVGAFCMDATEVTVAEYRKCLGAGKCTAPGTSGNCNWDQSDRANHPINCVDWEQSKAYCEWAGKRLPTEEEWEYAARGTAGRKYPWGDAEPSSQLCWDGEGSDQGKGKRKSTCQVGSYASGDTPEGIHDLAGNVWEWPSSEYCDSYAASKKCTGSRVGRGGCWNYGSASYVRGADRSVLTPGYRDTYLGFRCAR